MSEMEKLFTDFFFLFSRFEFALKEQGFLVKDINDAKANWACFSKTLEEGFVASEDDKVQNAKRYFSNSPPKKQVISNGSTEWRDVTPIHKNDLDLILQYIRRVRNNIFHGGKYFPKSNNWALANERHRLLIVHSTDILEWCYDNSSTEFRETFMYG